jgi:hypothetical protein
MHRIPLEFERDLETEELIGPKQAQRLTELIYIHVQDEDEREELLARVYCMSLEEAYNLIFEFSLSSRI